MNSILFRWKVRHLCFQFQHFQNVGDLPRDVVHGTEFQLVVNLPTQWEIVRHPTIGREKSSVCEDDSALPQKLFTEQSFVDVLPVKPDQADSYLAFYRFFAMVRHPSFSVSV